MYSVAISVASCLRAQTRVNVVWVVDGQGIPGLDLTEGVALTPGGGRMGSLANGAFDTQLVELANATSGRIVELQVGVHPGEIAPEAAADVVAPAGRGIGAVALAAARPGAVRGATATLHSGWWDSIAKLKSAPANNPPFDLMITDATQGAHGISAFIVERGTPGFSGADLANLVNEAALMAARAGWSGCSTPTTVNGVGAS